MDSTVHCARTGAGEREIMFHYERFRDSTEHLEDGETLRARLTEDGYLFLRTCCHERRSLMYVPGF